MKVKNLSKPIYNQEFDCWKSKLEINSNYSIDITIETENYQIIQINQSNHHIILTKITEIIQQETNIRFSTANKLLDLYNRSWNDKANIDCQTFSRQLKLKEIMFNIDKNSFQFWYDDGNLFLGHTIFVDVDADGLFQDAGIVG